MNWTTNSFNVTMKGIISIAWLLLISSTYCAELKKDVVFLPSIGSDSTDNAQIKKSSITPVLSTPMAWIAGDINKNPLRQISICTWVKSLEQRATGTVFAYVTSSERIEFGIVSINTKGVDKDENDPHILYVVIKGKRSNIPIQLGLDDVRWHHVCMTWSSRNGIWKVYNDGRKIAQGLGMKKGKVIAPGGRYYLGGGVFKWEDEDSIVNGSDISRMNYRVSTSFRAGRRKRNTFSTETKRMIGKFTDFYVWSKVVSKTHVRTLSNCSSTFRYKFNKEVKKDTSYANLFRPLRRKAQRKLSPLSWASRNVVFRWNVEAITLQKPATLDLPGDLCGYSISIECETNQILISVDRNIPEWYDVEDHEIHVNDRNCVPEIRGDYLVFHLPNLSTCGTQRKVVGNDVQYINTVSNTPKNGEIYFGRIFKADVLCKFPLNVSASSTQIITGKAPEVIDKTTITNPKTNKEDLEAVFVLSVDDEFTDPFRQGSSIRSDKTVWAGIAIQGIHENSDDVNVLVEKCWIDSEDRRVSLVNQQGCDESPARIFENGEKPNVRMELPTQNIKANTPTYIGCSFHPCIGEDCVPTCEKIEETNSVRSRKTRDTRGGNIIYELRAGPFIVQETSEENDELEDDNTLLIVTAVVPSVIVFLILVACGGGIIYFIMRKSRRMHNINNHYEVSDVKGRKSKRAIRTHSFTF
uniref:uncharacterized protein LOC120330170 n=1 Tax=Styela clava TaxID=7725 RepID=UPI00193A9F41|nr:uncharacterized protein LOC120330170 [Styela clava]